MAVGSNKNEKGGCVWCGESVFVAPSGKVLNAPAMYPATAETKPHSCPNTTPYPKYVSGELWDEAKLKAPDFFGLPFDPAARKTYPIATGVIDYFPDALAGVAHISFIGNQQHNPGQPLHWAKEKSQDEPDAMMRHFTHRDEKDEDGLDHAAKMCWRALAYYQKLIEARSMGMTMNQYNKYLRDQAQKQPG